jgi:integrase
VLSDAEVAAVWLNAPDNSYGTILKLLLLTGCRRDEIGGLKWNEVDLNARTITIPGSRTKNGEQHVIPLRTGIDKLGILPHICEAVLNHLPPKLVRTYNQNTYENEKRKALDAWAHHLKTIVAQATGAIVTALRKGEPRKPHR